MKYGQLTAAEGTEQKYQGELKSLQALVDEKERLLEAELLYGTDQAKAQKAVEELTNAENQLAAAQGKRAAVTHEENIEDLKDEQKLLDAVVKRIQEEDQATKQLFSAMKSAGGSSQGMNQMLSSAQSLIGYAKGADPYTKQIDQYKQHLNQMEQLTKKSAADIADINKTQADLQSAQDSLSWNQKLGEASAGFGMMAGLAQGFYELSGQQSKAAFMAYKAFSVAQAIISGITAVVAAYKDGCNWGGVVGGAAEAAIAGAVVTMQIAQLIARPPPSSSASSSSAVVGVASAATVVPTLSSTATATTAATTAATTTTPAAPRPLTVNLYVYGSLVDYDAFARQALPAIRKATQDGA